MDIRPRKVRRYKHGGGAARNSQASGNTHVPETSQGGVEPSGGEGGGNLYMKCSRDAALSRIPAPHLPKQEQLQLAGASFRDQGGGVLGMMRSTHYLLSCGLVSRPIISSYWNEDPQTQKDWHSRFHHP